MTSQDRPSPSGSQTDFEHLPRTGTQWLAYFENNARSLRVIDWEDPDRITRGQRAGLDLSISVLTTAEVIAQIYYAALQNATDSRALRTPCMQILSDELAHVRFQSRRLAILRRRYGRPAS